MNIIRTIKAEQLMSSNNALTPVGNSYSAAIGPKDASSQAPMATSQAARCQAPYTRSS